LVSSTFLQPGFLEGEQDTGELGGTLHLAIWGWYNSKALKNKYVSFIWKFYNFRRCINCAGYVTWNGKWSVGSPMDRGVWRGVFVAYSNVLRDSYSERNKWNLNPLF